MKNILIAFTTIFILFATTLFCQEHDANSPDLKITLNSKILNEDRSILIGLPKTYHDSSKAQKKYPVLILLDGPAHFNAAMEIGKAKALHKNGNKIIPETIVVAIENVDRERDFTVTKIKTKRINTMGGGRNFLDFIEQELIPHIDLNYKTEPHRILVGHSLGGLLAVNAYMLENSLFSAFIAIDPSIWWEQQMMTEKVKAISAKALEKKLYIATAGQGRGNRERNKKRHEMLHRLLNKRTTGLIKTKLDYFENESHQSVPYIALYKGLRYLYNENQ